MKKERGNGANIIILNPANEILLVRQGENYRKEGLENWFPLWMLPGGEIDRGESPRHAAQEESWEETRLVVDEQCMRLIALFIQKPNGLVTLYETREFSGEISNESTAEISEVAFMGISEILSRAGEISTGYMRMILRYIRCVQGIDPILYEGRLSDQVEYPKDILTKYEDLVLKI